jgi:hypothetical protein
MGLRVLLITYYLIRNISEDDIRCACKRCKNKNYLDPDVVMMHLLYIYKKRFLEKYLCLFAHEEPYVPYDTMVEKMIE